MHNGIFCSVNNVIFFFDIFKCPFIQTFIKSVVCSRRYDIYRPILSKRRGILEH